MELGGVWQARNNIAEFEDESGNIVAHQQNITVILIDYIQTKFTAQPVQISENLLEAIPQLVTAEDNSILEHLPTGEEIKNVVFELNQDGSPGPDGFTGVFYRFAWDIIKEDLIAAIQYCWSNQVNPAGLNSNFLVLLPKIKRAKKANQFRPIGLSNFCFKIFTKIIAIRMSNVLHKLISTQQCAFIKGRNIHEQVLLASELVNEMQFTRRWGNVGLKLEISQAYDTLSWEYLLVVLKKYGFSDWFCNWIHVLLKTTKISIMLNGGPIGYFGVGRGVKQGDPLSPILYVLAVDVLSRNIVHYIQEGKIQPMVIKKEEKKFITISWDKVCTPIEEGGLGIRRFEDINKALLMKLLWKILTSDEEWEKFFLAKYQDKNGVWITHFKKSSIWTGIKWVLHDFEDNTRWMVGDRKKISVWKDTWILESNILKMHPENDYIRQNIHMKVSDLIVDNTWTIPEEMVEVFPYEDLPLISTTPDKLIWPENQDGVFSVHSAINIFRQKQPKLRWYKRIWKTCVHPSTASNVWKITRGAYKTDENVKKRGMNISSRCYLCRKDQDSTNHLLWNCDYVKILSKWIGGVFAFKNPTYFDDIMQMSKDKSSVIQELWHIAAFSIMVDIWFTRNKLFFENISPDSRKVKHRIAEMIQDCEVRLKGYMNNSAYDLKILKYFNIGCRRVKSFKAI
ncbi:uncharacterized protein LOC113351839 [Papaver somniferum]|uniref:uncharacterized protein LOC113351839 n=1 Tax=Papaver somniferum TaxID=3469 RepID=UPI000E701833|nr:uncharacterized protein LOC113351839 [Papaver somniferum]